LQNSLLLDNYSAMTDGFSTGNKEIGAWS